MNSRREVLFCGWYTSCDPRISTTVAFELGFFTPSQTTVVSRTNARNVKFHRGSSTGLWTLVANDGGFGHRTFISICSNSLEVSSVFFDVSLRCGRSRLSSPASAGFSRCCFTVSNEGSRGGGRSVARRSRIVRFSGSVRCLSTSPVAGRAQSDLAYIGDDGVQRLPIVHHHVSHQ